MFAVVSARIQSAVSVPVAGPAVAPQMSSICESTAFSGTAVRHRSCGSIRDSKAPQRQARQPLSAASPLTRRGGLAVRTSNDEASRNEGNDGHESGGAGGQAATGGKGGSGGGDASQRGLRRSKQRVMRRGEGETAARVAKRANAAARGGVIAIMVERYESAEIEHVLLAGAEYSNLSNVPERKKNIDREEHRSCGVDTDEADQEKPLAPPRLQFLAAFMCCAIYSPMSSSATIETFQRYHEDLMVAALNVRGAQWEQFLTGVRKFKVTKPTGWCKHTANMVKFVCDIGDDVLRQAVVATVMKYKSVKLVPPESGFCISSGTKNPACSFWFRRKYRRNRAAK